MTPSQRRLNEGSQEKVASSWLSSIPLKVMDLILNKGEFVDAIRMRYGWPVYNLPGKCVCSEPFNTQHALSCKKGGFINQRHNQLRDFTTSLLNEVCTDVKSEPTLQPLSGESYGHRTANTTDEARLDISARGFWIVGRRAFFDIRGYMTRTPGATKILNYLNVMKGMSEKRNLKYNDRVLQTEHGSFTPLFSATGGMAPECQLFYKRLALLLSEKKNSHYSVTKSWLNTKLSFNLLRSVLLCVRGSRNPYYHSPNIEHLEMNERLRSSF
ncbi:Uncharacterised protein r2_g3110 [Pycnogonum litorale]